MKGRLRHSENSKSESCLDLEKNCSGREEAEPLSSQEISLGQHNSPGVESEHWAGQHGFSGLTDPGAHVQPGFTSGLSGTFAKPRKPTENITLEENCIHSFFFFNKSKNFDRNLS